MATIVARQALGLNEALREAARVSAELRRCAALPRGDAEYRYSQYVSLVHALLAALRRCEMTGATSEAIRAASADARQVHRLSPLCTRLQDWPRGYPGDFETVEYLCEGVNHAPVDSFGHAIEAYALRSAAAQQHRNKVEEQAAVVARRLALTTGPVRILSIGCGGSRDLLALRRHCPDPRAIGATLRDAERQRCRRARVVGAPPARDGRGDQVAGDERPRGDAHARARQPVLRSRARRRPVRLPRRPHRLVRDSHLPAVAPA